MFFDVTIIGAGVVGLSIAKFCSEKGYSVVVLEQESRAGEGISSRNSGVIHAGLYYPEDYLKTSLCIEGNKLLYRYAIDKNINHKKYGKCIIASSEFEIAKLENILKQAKINNVEIYEADISKVKEDNPGLIFKKALFSPSSGVIDVPEYVLSLIHI